MRYKKKPKSSLVPMNLIIPCSAQPRKYFDEKRMEHLCESIKKYGLIHPITIRPIGSGEYELIAGERRFRACEMAGFTDIPAVIVNVDDKKAALMALSENISRDSLLFTERAKSCVDLLNKYNFSREELASELGITLSEISLYIRYFDLSFFTRKLIRQYELSDKHIALILSMENKDKQCEAVQKICLSGLDVKQSRQLIKALNENRRRIIKIKNACANEQFFKNTINKALGIIRSNGVDADMSETTSPDGVEFKINIKKAEETQT